MMEKKIGILLVTFILFGAFSVVYAEENQETSETNSFDIKIQRLDEIIESQLSNAIIWQVTMPRCCDPKRRALSESDHKKNEEFNAAKEKLKKIVQGVTTRKEILEWFGQAQLDSGKQIKGQTASNLLINTLPKVNDRQAVLSYEFELTKIEGSRVNTPYGVILLLHFILDRDSNLIDDIRYTVMISYE